MKKKITNGQLLLSIDITTLRNTLNGFELRNGFRLYHFGFCSRLYRRLTGVGGGSLMNPILVLYLVLTRRLPSAIGALAAATLFLELSAFTRRLDCGHRFSARYLLRQLGGLGHTHLGR